MQFSRLPVGVKFVVTMGTMQNFVGQIQNLSIFLGMFREIIKIMGIPTTKVGRVTQIFLGVTIRVRATSNLSSSSISSRTGRMVAS